MSYTAGIAPNMAALGFTPGPPHITCDGCGVRREVTRASGLPFAWFLAGRPVPRWAEWTPARIAAWVAPLRSMAVGSREWSAEWHRLMAELMDDMRAQLERQQQPARPGDSR